MLFDSLTKARSFDLAINSGTREPSRDGNLFAGRSARTVCATRGAGRVNTAKFPEEFRSRENLGDLGGMHLRRYVGNVTSRRRHRICYNGWQTFPFPRRCGVNSAPGTRARSSRDLATWDSGLNDLAAPYVPQNLRSRQI